jgi:hypothetical protein
MKILLDAKLRKGKYTTSPNPLFHQEGIFLKIETTIENSSNSSRNIVTEWYAEKIGLVKAEIVIGGGGLMGIIRDLLGYGTITFELKEIRKNCLTKFLCRFFQISLEI